MNPSEQEPSPIHGKDLSDLISLLERNPEVLKQLKETLNAESPVSPAAASVPAMPAQNLPPAPPPSPRLPDSQVSPVNRQVPATRAAISKPSPALATHGTSKAAPKIKSAPPSSPIARKEAPEKADSAPPVPSAPPTAVPAKRRVWEKIGGGALTVAVLIHVLLLILAAFWFFKIIESPKKTVDFMPTGGGGGERGAQYNVQQKKLAQITPSTNVKRVFAEGATSNFSIPDPGDSFGEMSPLTSLGGGGLSGGLGGSGLGAGFGKGSGNGVGSALGGAGTGKLFGLTKFGALSGPGLTGYFYDLKQTNQGKPSDILSQGDVTSQYMNVLKDFTKNWDPQILEKYYRGQKPLFATQIYVTNGPSDDAAKAFGEEKNCSGYQWIVHYKGRCVAPKDGTFRFIGRGDNVMVVRLNDKIVLDGGFEIQTYTVAHEVNTSDNLGPAGPTGWTLAGGAWFKVRRGDVVNLEVLIGDGGGLFSDYLLIEEKGAKYADRKDAPGFPAYPLFQLAKTPVPKEAGENGNPQPARQPLVFDFQF